jgi:glycosyltransferase involved in cell wall biosynthesis
VTPPDAPEAPRIRLLFLTYNRLHYTRLALPRLLEDATEDFELVVWDNGSTDGTPDYLRGVRDRRLQELVLRPRNEGQAAAVQHAWSGTGLELCGKVDNDCLVTPGWTRILAAAHRDLPQLGGIGCWHFMPEDFDQRLAAHKLRTFQGHRVLVHPHIGGTGFLTKHADYERFGPVDPQYLLSSYWARLAARGRVNGWYFPLVPLEHMDDPRSPHCDLPEELDDSAGSWITRTRGFRTRAEYERWIRNDARAILTAPAELGRRARLRELRARAARAVRRLIARDA